MRFGFVFLSTTHYGKSPRPLTWGFLFGDALSPATANPNRRAVNKVRVYARWNCDELRRLKSSLTMLEGSILPEAEPTEG